MMFLRYFVLIVTNSCFINCWDLTHFGINDHYFVSSIAVFRTRTFLSLPRIACNNETSPTVVEVNWNSDSILSSYVSGRNKILDYQEWGQCDKIQNAISIGVESRKLKLWILDKGNDKCAPKLWSFSLLYNHILENIDFIGVPKTSLYTLVIGQRNTDHENKAFIGNAGENAIIVVSLKESRWWKLFLMQNDHFGITVRADYLTVSKTDTSLFITGKSDAKLFSCSLDIIAEQMETVTYSGKGTVIKVNVTLLGETLGLSTGLESDYKAGLNYYMERDYAILRWTTGLPVIAENHNVLAQSYELLPYVSQLFTGPHYGLWALVNPLNEEECMRKQQKFIKVEQRVVQILKYNMFVKELEVGETVNE